MTYFGHEFSVDMKSKAYVRRISLSNEAWYGLLFEGDLREIEEVAFVGGSVLEVRGTHRVLRVKLGQREAEKLMNSIRA